MRAQSSLLGAGYTEAHCVAVVCTPPGPPDLCHQTFHTYDPAQALLNVAVVCLSKNVARPSAAACMIWSMLFDCDTMLGAGCVKANGTAKACHDKN